MSLDKPKKLTPLERFEQFGFTSDGLGPWSHSKLKLLKKCPFNFYLQYILKYPASEEDSVVLVTEVGKAAHLILEYVMKGKSVADSYKLARKDFTATLSDAEWEEHVVTLEYNITNFKERMETFDKNIGIKRVHQELRIGVNKNWEPTGFFADDVFFRGVIDLVLQVNGGDVIYLDHKTGAAMIGGLKNFMDQLNTYKVLFHYGIEKTTGAQSGIHYIREGDILLSEYVDADHIENSLRNRLEFSIEGTIEYVKELGYFKHFAGNQCNWCQYKTACKSKQLLPLEKESKKYFEIKQVK